MAVIFTLVYCLCSFKAPHSFHLITGSWQPVEATEVKTPNKKLKVLSQWYFGGDQITSRVSDFSKKKEQTFGMAYRIILDVPGQTKPYLLLKSSCDENFVVGFTIEELTKRKMVLKRDTTIGSGGIELKTHKIEFERVAGPPENMD